MRTPPAAQARAQRQTDRTHGYHRTYACENVARHTEPRQFSGMARDLSPRILANSTGTEDDDDPRTFEAWACSPLPRAVVRHGQGGRGAVPRHGVVEGEIELRELKLITHSIILSPMTLPVNRINPHISTGKSHLQGGGFYCVTQRWIPNGFPHPGPLPN